MPTADYVIVGAGSAGCVLANRLTEDPGVRVLLLEAGGRDRSPNIKIPAAFSKQFHTKLDWDFATEPEPYCDQPLALHTARPLAGRIELDERDALRARAAARLRHLGGARRHRLGLGRGAALLPEGREQRARGLRVPRHRRTPERGRPALAAEGEREVPRRRRGRRDSPHRRLQRAGAGRRVHVPGAPARRAALERGRRLPAPGDGPGQPPGGDRRPGSRPRAGGRARHRRPLRPPRPREERGHGRARGDPRRRGDRVAAAPDAVRDRPGRAPERDGRAGPARAGGRRGEPPGPPLHHLPLRAGRRGHALRRGQAASRWPSGSCAAADR